jgi:penicillin-binding protein 2
MVIFSSLCRISLLCSLSVLPWVTQNLLAADLVKANVPTGDLPPSRNANEGAIITRKDARTITLKIPGPRGLIVDRNGEVLAQNRVVYQVALQYRQFENATRDFVVNWARTRLETLPELVKNALPMTDDELYSHYKERRWLPLYVTGQLDEKQAHLIEKKLTSGLVLQPIYSRYYPHDDLAAHIIGYSGSVGKLPTGPINANEPLWEESEGRAGLEKLFNNQLTGDSGMKRLLFDENGNKTLEEQVKRPRPGGTLVTTLNYKWQVLAEKTLKAGCRRGAFVVVDVITGEVLVMASRPGFDLNCFIPGINEKDYKALNDDVSQPLFGRAFQSAYPPASSFKPIVALTALNEGKITKNTEIYCPASITIGRTVMRNWSKIPEGSINVDRALARSCNTWFYQVGIQIGPNSFLSLARRLGFGEKSGLPLIGETPGLVPNDEWMLKNEHRHFLDGDTANLSIGQGSLLASPLQVAQAMAGIANGGALPKLQLIRQVQDTQGRVVKVSVPERRTLLGVTPEAIEIVHQGMSDVVNGPGGTGTAAQLSYTKLCGKTGTAQWGPKAKEQRLAWFAGFLPEENPRYSFAVLYEGAPGETVSGGRMAAPMVKKFFEGIKDDIKDIIAPPQKALIVVDENTPDASDPNIPKAIPKNLDDNGEGVNPLHPAPPVSEGPVLKALPVQEPEEVNDEPIDVIPNTHSKVDEKKPVKALPVKEDEIIQEKVEEP